MLLHTVRTIICLKRLLLRPTDRLLQFCVCSNINYIMCMEYLFHEILESIKQNPNMSMDHYIYTHKFASCLSIVPPNTFEVKSQNLLYTYIHDIRPCYISWVQALWKKTYSTETLEVSPLFCEFLNTIIHLPHLL